MGNRATESSSKTIDKHGVVLGNLALQRGWLTSDQLRDALVEQAREFGPDRKPRSLGAILIERGLLTAEQVDEILQEQKKVKRESRDFRASLQRTPKPAKAPPPATPRPQAPKSFGKYSLARAIGQGGMAEVYEAVDPQLDRRVALKILKSHPDADPSQAKQDEERFLRESRLSANLPKHPNIVGVYEAGVVDGRRYIATELIDGEPMDDWRARNDPTLRAQIAMLRDIALAVHHAHEHGIVHRDLKPQNILVDAKHQPHVTDFGLAKAVRHDTNVSLTGAGMTVGTPAYMSPEQAQGSKTADARADVYSLGVILYEFLADQTPFNGDTAVEIIVQAARDPVPPPSRVLKASSGKRVDRGLERICLRALARKPDDRFPTAQALALSLSQWLKGDAPASGSSGRKALIGVGALAAAGAIAAALFLFRPAPPTAEPPPAPPVASPPPAPTHPAAPAGMEYAGMNTQGYHEYRHAKDGSVMILVPESAFTMGSEDGNRNEKPRHTRRVGAYLIDKHEITVGQFRRFVEETGYRTDAERGTPAGVFDGRTRKADPHARWNRPGYPQEDDHPVTCVTWKDAAAYSAWAGKRLPTEAEWERAARGEDGRVYAWGDEWTSSRANTGDTGRTFAVGTFPTGASPVGALDLTGNVAEYTADRYRPHHGEKAMPQRARPGEPDPHVLKGGSWYDDTPQAVRAARRLGRWNATQAIGFRGARSYP